MSVRLLLSSPSPPALRGQRPTGAELCAPAGNNSSYIEAIGVPSFASLLNPRIKPVDDRRESSICIAVADTISHSSGDGGSGSWLLLIDAIRLYRATKGDLLIEQGWCVPSDAPWPPPLHGRRLARVVYDLQFWQQHLAAYPERRAELEQLGFLWGRLQPEYNLVVEALMVYKELYGDLLVPSTFVVPDGDFISNAVTVIQEGGDVGNARRGESSGNREGRVTGARCKIAAAAATTNKQRFESTGNRVGIDATVATATRTPQRKIKGVLATGTVTQKTPTNPWPRSCWRMRLGQRVASVRSRNDYLRSHPERWYQLDAMGFVWEASEVKWQTTLLALQHYCRIHHHAMVPRSFVVPNGEFDLVAPPGANGTSALLDESISLTRTAPMAANNLFAATTTAGNSATGDVAGFGKSGPNMWPRSTWGLKLGVVVANIRTKRTFLGETATGSTHRTASASSIASPRQQQARSSPTAVGSGVTVGGGNPVAANLEHPERLRALRKLGFAFDTVISVHCGGKDISYQMDDCLRFLLCCDGQLEF
jgi:hypothetical protein